MRKILTLMLGFLFLSSCTDSVENVDSALEISNPVSKASKIIVVRHAEKEEGEDPGLTVAGKMRAEELALIAQSLGVNVIFTSQYRRTVDTARPSSQKLDIPITQYEINRSNMNEYPSVLAEMIRSDYEGKTSLIVTHSNLFMPIVEQFVDDSGLKGIEETEYTKMAVIHALDDETSLVMGTFGVEISKKVSN